MAVTPVTHFEQHGFQIVNGAQVERLCVRLDQFRGITEFPPPTDEGTFTQAIVIEKYAGAFQRN